ncbi:MAG: alpha/beta hydrolase [Planctomycetes bacterium]|nr:alpha/beta hydrolase [Planctomycetota bacterium]
MVHAESPSNKGLAAEPALLDVWPGRPPGVGPDAKLEMVIKPAKRFGRRVVKNTKPTLTVQKPPQEKDTGAAVVICPGGGYNVLADVHEGTEIAEWLNEIGVTAIILRYRVPRSKTQQKHVGPLQDAQRAMGLVRKHAKQWGIDPQRIGLMGFSAGGHLSATTGTNFKKRTYAKLDDADELSCRPDFLMLIYPAYLTTERGSLDLASEIHVDAETPPTFFVHTGDDPIPSYNSIAYYVALKKAGVKAEMHLYPSGGHGYGLGESDHAVSTWPQRAEHWLKNLGVLRATER